jgi:hypothetical protein
MQAQTKVFAVAAEIVWSGQVRSGRKRWSAPFSLVQTCSTVTQAIASRQYLRVIYNMLSVEAEGYPPFLPYEFRYAARKEQPA